MPYQHSEWHLRSVYAQVPSSTRYDWLDSPLSKMNRKYHSWHLENNLVNMNLNTATQFQNQELFVFFFFGKPDQSFNVSAWSCICLLQWVFLCLTQQVLRLRELLISVGQERGGWRSPGRLIDKTTNLISCPHFPIWQSVPNSHRTWGEACLA